VPVGIDAIKNKYNTGNYVKVQRLISLRIAKAYRTISHEALCILTGLTPITIKGEDVATLYYITKGRNNQKYQIDKEENPSSWLLPAEMFRLNSKKYEGEEYLWHNFTGCSKSEQGVGSRVDIFAGMVLTEQLKFKLDYRRSINQAKHLAIVKALEVIQTELVNHNEHSSAAIYTDSKITLDSIRSAKNPTTSKKKSGSEGQHLTKSGGKYNLNGWKLNLEIMEMKSQIDLQRRQPKTATHIQWDS